ncbi:Prolyl oligopeptidase [Phytophthora cinnamomi]|uniref:Prolyl oligopeptidase n=1 Tax=Phytophthora cinnamomi TaxID=4785 RepID=UPI00355ABBCA|nr:Prolyl oligopeptidase [Phytophthora cinnamomi]
MGGAATTNATVAEYIAAATTEYGGLVNEYLGLCSANGFESARLVLYWRQTAGAYRMSEINYCFNSLYGTDSPWEADDNAIAEVMSTYWANFVENLYPNGGNLAY